MRTGLRQATRRIAVDAREIVLKTLTLNVMIL